MISQAQQSLSARSFRPGFRVELLGGFLLAIALAASARAEDPPARIDYLTFARGALVVSVGGDTATRGVGKDSALAAIDGNSAKYSLANKMFSAEFVTEFTVALPAATIFDRFAVPGVVETPSPSQTFTRHVEVLGSAVGPDSGFVLLATG